MSLQILMIQILIKVLLTFHHSLLSRSLYQDNRLCLLLEVRTAGFIIIFTFYMFQCKWILAIQVSVFIRYIFNFTLPNYSNHLC